MAKQAKKKQTDWTKQGKSIADTSVPLYKDALNLQADYLSNPTQYLDEYLNKYWSNNADQSDFLREYDRRMSNATANNYAATTGGYTSSGQRAYDDTQRYMNDRAARLQTQGVNQAGNLVNQWYGNLNTGLGNYRSAYALGQPYSDIDQYNYIVGQGNGVQNQIAGLASGAGKVLSTIPTPWTQAIGAGLQAAGNLGSIDTSTALGQSGGGSGSSWTDIASSVGLGLNTMNKLGNPTLKEYFGGKTNEAQPTENIATVGNVSNTYTPYTLNTMAQNQGQGKKKSWTLGG